MTLVSLLVRIVVVVGILGAVATLTIIGPARLRQLRRTYRSRLRGAVPYLAILGLVLGINRVMRDVGPEVSWLIQAYDLTPYIYRIERDFVVWIQSFATPELTTYFSMMYVYGYVFLLVFPVVAYLAVENQQWLRETMLAYSLNYAVGLVFYILFIVWGPRQYIVTNVDGLLYTFWPTSQVLTSQVNSNTNAFPSLHTSLAVTVVILAWRSRAAYPRWLPVSIVFAVSIVVSTMYLGIHWGIDVLAGVLLAVACVAGAIAGERYAQTRDWQVGWTGRVLARLTGLEHRIRTAVDDRR